MHRRRAARGTCAAAIAPETLAAGASTRRALRAGADRFRASWRGGSSASTRSSRRRRTGFMRFRCCLPRRPPWSRMCHPATLSMPRARASRPSCSDTSRAQRPRWRAPTQPSPRCCGAPTSERRRSRRSYPRTRVRPQPPRRARTRQSSRSRRRRPTPRSRRRRPPAPFVRGLIRSEVVRNCRLCVQAPRVGAVGAVCAAVASGRDVGRLTSAVLPRHAHRP